MISELGKFSRLSLVKVGHHATTSAKNSNCASFLCFGIRRNNKQTATAFSKLPAVLLTLKWEW
jgi:hypothetical protein